MRRFAELLGAPLGATAPGRRRTGDAARAPAGAGAHRAGQPAARHRPRRRRGSPSCSTRSASPPRRPATTSTSTSRRGATTPRPRSTSSRRSPATTATRASAARCRGPPPPAGSSPRQAERRRAAVDCSSGSGSPRPCRCRSSRPATWRACGLARRRHHDRQPAGRRGVGAAHVAAARACVGAVAYNWSHRNHGVRLFEIGHMFNRAVVARRRAARRARARSARVLAGPRRPTAVELWRFVAEALGRRRRRASRTPRSPGLHPTRSARILRGRRRRSARSARSTPACSTPTASASGWLPRGRPRHAARPAARRPAPFRPVSRFPSSDIDLAFEVDDDVPASAVEDAIRAAAGDLLWSVAPVRRLPRRRRGRRPPQPRLHACASRPPTAPSPTPTSPRSAPRSSTPSSPASPPPSAAERCPPSPSTAPSVRHALASSRVGGQLAADRDRPASDRRERLAACSGNDSRRPFEAIAMTARAGALVATGEPAPTRVRRVGEVVHSHATGRRARRSPPSIGRLAPSGDPTVLRPQSGRPVSGVQTTSGGAPLSPGGRSCQPARGPPAAAEPTSATARVRPRPPEHRPSVDLVACAVLRAQTVWIYGRTRWMSPNSCQR